MAETPNQSNSTTETLELEETAAPETAAPSTATDATGVQMEDALPALEELISPDDAAPSRVDPKQAAQGGDAQDSPAPEGTGTQAPEPDETALTLAKAAGLDEATAKALHKAGALDSVVSAFTGRLVAEGQQLLQGNQPPQAAAQPPAPAPAPQPQAAPEPFEWLPTTDGDQFDANLRKNVEGYVGKTLNSQIQSIRKEIVEALGPDIRRMRQREAAEANRQFEGFIEKQGEAWQDVFGKGPTRKLAQGSKELESREKFAKSVIAIDAAMQARGLASDGSDYTDMVYRMALTSTFGDRIKQQAVAEVQKQVAQRKGQFTHPPTRRQSATLTDPDAPAKENVAAWKRAQGIPQPVMPVGNDDDVLMP